MPRGAKKDTEKAERRTVVPLRPPVPVVPAEQHTTAAAAPAPVNTPPTPAANASATASRKARAVLSPKEELESRTKKLKRVASNLRKRCARFTMPTLIAAMGNIDNFITLVETEIRALPADWKPTLSKGERRGGPKKKEFTAGQKVQIREKNREEYDGLLDSFTGLEVVDVRGGGKKVAVKSGNNRAVIPVGHLEPVPEAAPAGEPEAVTPPAETPAT